jgi:hypothetical protein
MMTDRNSLVDLDLEPIVGSWTVPGTACDLAMTTQKGDHDPVRGTVIVVVVVVVD